METPIFQKALIHLYLYMQCEEGENFFFFSKIYQGFKISCRINRQTDFSLIPHALLEMTTTTAWSLLGSLAHNAQPANDPTLQHALALHRPRDLMRGSPSITAYRLKLSSGNRPRTLPRGGWGKKKKKEKTAFIFLGLFFKDCQYKIYIGKEEEKRKRGCI